MFKKKLYQGKARTLNDPAPTPKPAAPKPAQPVPETDPKPSIAQ